jgi:sulfur-oxidizing protein SoxA
MTRGGILTSGAAAVALIAAGAFIVAAGSGANAQAKKEVPLDIKGDASIRPWKRYAGWPTRDGSKFNTLAKLASPPAPKAARKIAGPITGDAKKGAELAADRNRGGSCLACHVMGQPAAPVCRAMSAPDLSKSATPGARTAVQLHL